jgi:four helix bundle protein
MGATRQANEALEDRLLNFAADCGKAVDALPETRMGRHIAGQLIRCGTSVAPNFTEDCAAESRNDFVHKLGIARKELRTSRVWLRKPAKCDLQPPPILVPLTDECTQLMNIIGKSIVTAKSSGQCPGSPK